MIISAVVIILTGLISVVLLFRNESKVSRLSKSTLPDLLDLIQPVDKRGILTLATDHMRLTEVTTERTPDEIWDLVGGADGLTRMKENVDVFLALASYAQCLNFDEAVLLTVRMRQDAFAVNRAIIGLGLGQTCGYGSSRVTFYVREAASSYYLMSQRLLAFYKANYTELYPVLMETV